MKTYEIQQEITDLKRENESLKCKLEAEKESVEFYKGLVDSYIILLKNTADGYNKILNNKNHDKQN